MAKHTKIYNCPECEVVHEIEFDFWHPTDGDEEEEIIKCKCGCEFMCFAEIEVEYHFNSSHPNILKSGKVDFDINDTSTWPQENDPNQLSII